VPYIAHSIKAAHTPAARARILADAGIPAVARRARHDSGGRIKPAGTYGHESKQLTEHCKRSAADPPLSEIERKLVVDSLRPSAYS